MLTEDVFTHASIEQASSHRATIEAEHRACIEPASSLHRATASSQHRAFSIEHRGRGSDTVYERASAPRPAGGVPYPVCRPHEQSNEHANENGPPHDPWSGSRMIPN